MDHGNSQRIADRHGQRGGRCWCKIIRAGFIRHMEFQHGISIFRQRGISIISNGDNSVAEIFQ